MTDKLEAAKSALKEGVIAKYKETHAPDWPRGLTPEYVISWVIDMLEYNGRLELLAAEPAPVEPAIYEDLVMWGFLPECAADYMNKHYEALELILRGIKTQPAEDVWKKTVREIYDRMIKSGQVTAEKAVFIIENNHPEYFVDGQVIDPDPLAGTPDGVCS